MFKRLIKASLSLAVGKLTLLVLLVGLLALSPPVASGAESPKKVLIFSSDDQFMPGVAILNQSLRSTLNNGLPGQVQFFFESQDSLRISTEKYEEEMVRLLKRKYEGERIDLIYALARPALALLLKHRGELFSATPIIYIVNEHSRIADLNLGSNVIGVEGQLELTPTLDIALALQPQTQRVVMVAGKMAVDTAYLERAQQEFRPYERKVELTYLIGLPIEELQKKLAGLPDKSIVFYLTVGSEYGGQGYTSPEVLALIAPSSRAPIFGPSLTYLGKGMVGGRLIDHEMLGTRAAEIGLRIMAGESAQSIPLQIVPSTTMFDWRELRRWGISEASLPPGSEVRFKQLTFWEQYRWHIIGLLAFSVFEALLIAVLLIERRRRWRAMIQLDKRVRFERLLSKLSAEFTDLPASRVDTVVKQWLDRLTDFLGDVTISFFEVPRSDGAVTAIPSEDSSPLPRALTVDDVKDDEWCLGQLRKGTTINLANMPAELSHQTNGEKPVPDLKSLLAVPVAVNGTTFALALGSNGSYSDWGEDQVSQLRLVGEVFAGALERKRAGEELQRTRNDLAHVARVTAMGEMAASIAHEVNQPLAAIATYGDACVRLLAGDSPNVKKSLEAINHIISDSMRASEVIKRIRALVKKTDHESTPQDLNQIILEMVALTDGDVQSKSVQLKLHLAQDLPLVLGDHVELQQVMLNLILNGIEAMSGITDRTRDLTITSSRNQDGQVVVTVQDSGVGLDPEQARRIFDPFVTTKPNGLGMGLSISRTILEAHGGTLTAEPNNGPGATFQFTLPVAGAEQ